MAKDDRAPIQKVRVEIKVEDGDDWNAPVIADVEVKQTLAGHILGESDDFELAEFIRETVIQATERAVAEISAQATLAAIRRQNAPVE